MIVITKAKAAWSEQRTCWRLDVQYLADGASKRTFIVIPLAEPDKAHGAAAAERAAKDFRRGHGTIFQNFMASKSDDRPAPRPKHIPSPMRSTKGPVPTVSWLLHTCLAHPEVWGSVKHSKNYRSGVRKLDALIGDRLVSEFEPPHGRKLVVDLISKLRAEEVSDGYVRKITYHLRQALSAAIGQGVTEPIGHPVTGEQLLADIPTFPALAKSKPRTAILDKAHDKIVFEVIQSRFRQAREEERAFRIKMGCPENLSPDGVHGRIELRGEVVWLNPRRFSSSQWMSFESYIMFLIETGCRRSEALSVGNHSLRDREVIDDDGQVVETYPVLFLPGEVTKNGDDRFINLTPKLVDLLPVWKATAVPHSFEIGDRTIDRPFAWFPLAPNQVTGMWQHVREDARRLGVDLSSVSPHQLRHTHATRMSARGMSGKPLQDHLGHRDERTTRIYDHAQQVENSRKFYARNVGG